MATITVTASNNLIISDITDGINEVLYSISRMPKDRLGQGNYSTVVKSTRREPMSGRQEDLACKLYPLVGDCKTCVNVSNAFEREKRITEIMAKSSAFRHCQNIIKYMDWYYFDNVSGHPLQVIFMELLPPLTLEQYLDRIDEDDAYFDADFILEIFCQLITALTICHGARIAHGDIKVENVIYDIANDRMVLVDFNSACYNQTFVWPERGSPLYMSPEMLREPPDFYNPYLADIWALGQLCFEVITLKPMFGECKRLDCLQRKVCQWSTRNLVFESHYDDYKDIFNTVVNGFLKNIPHERTSLEEMECIIKDFQDLQ